MNAVTLTSSGRVGVVKFTNGPANYFTADLLNAVADAMGEAHEQGLRAIVLSSGGRHFCAGADFSAIDPTPSARAAVARATYAAGARLFRQPLPVVAAVQGAAIGGGLGLACSADFRIVTPDSRLEANFTRLGFHPGFALSVVLERIIGAQAASRMLLMSERVSGSQALDYGLADRMVGLDQLIEEATEFAAELASLAPLAIQAIRATMRRDLLQQIDDVLRWEAAEQERLWATEDAQIGLGAAKNREIPEFVGR